MSSRKNRTTTKKTPKAGDETPGHGKPSRDEAELAVRTLLRWIGDDPDREGLVSTPSRVVRAFDDWYSGYRDDPVEFLRRTFREVDGYDEMIVLRDIHFESHCEHHMGLSGTGPKAGGPSYLPRFATEQTVTTNTAAVGGNATLLSLAPAQTETRHNEATGKHQGKN